MNLKRMGKTSKFNYKELLKRETVSETESESSSEEKIQHSIIHNTSKIKKETHYSSEVSDNDFKSKKFVSENLPSRSNKQSTNFVIQNISKSNKKKHKDSLENNLANTEDETSFQTNKYVLNNSFQQHSGHQQLGLHNNNDSSSSSSEQDGLKSAFLGKFKSKKIRSKKLNQSTPVSTKSTSFCEDSSSDENQNSSFTSKKSSSFQATISKVKDKMDSDENQNSSFTSKKSPLLQTKVSKVKDRVDSDKNQNSSFTSKKSPLLQTKLSKVKDKIDSDKKSPSLQTKISKVKEKIDNDENQNSSFTGKKSPSLQTKMAKVKDKMDSDENENFSFTSKKSPSLQTKISKVKDKPDSDGNQNSSFTSKMSPSLQINISKVNDKIDSDENQNSSFTSKKSHSFQKNISKVKDNTVLQNGPTILQQNISHNKNTPEKNKLQISKKLDRSTESILNNIEDNKYISDSESSDKGSEISVQTNVSSRSRVEILQNIRLSPMKHVQLLEELYPNLTPRDIEDSFHISSNEDVYLLRLPKTINPQDLINTKVKLTEGSKLKINHEKYKLESSNKAFQPFLLVGNGSTPIEPKNSFFVTKYVKPTKIPELEIKPKANVPLPENLKTRHPLFGSNYEDEIQLSEDAERRLQKAIEECLKQKEKPKKKKKNKHKVSDEIQNEVIFNLLDKHTSVKNVPENQTTKKEKKRRSSIFGGTSLFESTRIDFKPELAEENMTISQSVVEEENVVNSQSFINDTIRKIKTELLTEYESEMDEKFPTKKKKKKRKSLQNQEEIIDNTIVNNIKEEMAMSDYEPYKKKKRTLSMGYDHNEVKKVKRKNRSSLQNGEYEELDNTMLYSIKQEIMSDYESSKKKRRTTSTMENDDNEEGKRKNKIRILKNEEELIDDIPQDTVMYDYIPSKSNVRTMSLKGDSEVKKTKKKKNSSLDEKNFSIENEVDSLLEKIKREKKMHV